MKTSHKKIVDDLRSGGFLCLPVYGFQRQATLYDSSGKSIRLVRINTIHEMREQGILDGQWKLII